MYSATESGVAQPNVSSRFLVSRNSIPGEVGGEVLSIWRITSYSEQKLLVSIVLSPLLFLTSTHISTTSCASPPGSPHLITNCLLMTYRLKDVLKGQVGSVTSCSSIDFVSRKPADNAKMVNAARVRHGLFIGSGKYFG